MKKPRRTKGMAGELAALIEKYLTEQPCGDLVDFVERKGKTIFVKADDGFVYKVAVSK
jgi:hypothetical protein